ALKERGFTERVRDQLKFLAFAPIVFVSARSGKGIGTLLSTADRVRASCAQRVTTGQLNRLLMRAAQLHAPKAAKGGHAVRILVGAQIGTSPPTFLVSINHPVDLHFAYKRYLENQIRDEFGFEGAPIVLKVKARRH